MFRYLNRNVKTIGECCIHGRLVNSPIKGAPIINELRLPHFRDDNGRCVFVSNIHSSANVSSSTVRIPDFTDTKVVYKAKSFRELFRAYFVFTLCSFEFVVNNQKKILQWSRKLLGRRLFCKLMEMTIAGQFLAGEHESEVLGVARRNAEAGLFTMLAYTASESHGAAEGLDDPNAKDIFEVNEEAVMHSIDMASKSKDFSHLTPQLATKVTFFTSVDVLFALNETIEQQGQLLQTIWNTNGDATKFQSFLNDVFDECKSVYSEFGMPKPNNSSTVELSSLVTSVPFNLVLNRRQGDLISFLEDQAANVPSLRTLSPEEEQKILALWKVFDKFGKNCHKESVALLMDGEQSYVQLAIEGLTFDLMRKYNRDRPIIHNTYQCYRTRTHDILVRDLELVRREGLCLGFKVVRGAYLDEERQRAKDLGYEDPINPTYDATTEMYQKVATHLLKTIHTSDDPKRFHATFATHNQDTVKFVLDKIVDLGVPLDNNNVAFAQLVGMRDHISFGLGQANIPAAKLLCYGNAEEGVIWLSRRVVENRQGMLTADQERTYLFKEMKHRLHLSPRPIDL